MSPRKVLLYGASLLLSLVAESLKQSPGLHVTRVVTWTDADRELETHTPDVVIFDLADSCESHVLPLLFKNPNLLLLGLDPESNRAVALSGHETHSLTLTQLEELVQQEPPFSPPDARPTGSPS